MAKFFIYYSLSGNGDFVAELLKEQGYDAFKVETIKPIGKPNFFRILKFGGDAMMKKKAKIKNISVEIKEGDEVIIGSPIWNDRLSTPINAALDVLPLDKQTTKFILYPAGNDTKKSFKQLRKLGFIQQPLIISYPLKKQENAKQLIKGL